MKLASGHPVLHFDRIDSTNLEARRLADAGERGPLWIVADEQTGGRGRMGRNWVSEPGNLYATFLFSVATGPEVAAQVSFVAALAVHDMAAALTTPLPLVGRGRGRGSGTDPIGPRTNAANAGATPTPNPSPQGGGEHGLAHLIKIKWPNDVLIGGAKFCGVLPEVVGTSPLRLAIGCGVNAAHAPAGTPYPVTCLGAHVAVESILQELDSTLSNRLKIWDGGRGFTAIREAWEKRAMGMGGGVSAGGESGTFTGLAADGALLLTRADGSTVSIHSGEVAFAELEALRRR